MRRCLPLRNPFVLVKQVAALDHMSGGRIELGIGVACLWEEFVAIGVPFEECGRREDEYVAVMRALRHKGSAALAGCYVAIAG
jgi:alkanesulfonate monooxygenase SsuD/methylene tetrahydromethanopterin reductase-like flavin-dependent oxidoreductase (luciferase family)